VKRGLVVATLVAFLLPVARAEAQPPPGDDQAPAAVPAVLGARGPRPGALILSLGAGAVVMVPHATLALRAGTGAGTSVEVGYRNLAVFGQGVHLRAGWGRPIGAGHHLIGVAVRSSYGTLRLAPTELVGIRFGEYSLGNEWDAGADLVATVHRRRGAQLTLALGATASLATPATDSAQASGHRLRPFLRSLNASVQGEWPVGAGRAFYLRLDAVVLVRAELRPIGFLPTSTAGFAWGWGT
jgi:hypothetical protein